MKMYNYLTLVLTIFALSTPAYSASHLTPKDCNNQTVSLRQISDQGLLNNFSEQTTINLFGTHRSNGSVELLDVTTIRGQEYCRAEVGDGKISVTKVAPMELVTRAKRIIFIPLFDVAAQRDGDDIVVPTEEPQEY